MRKAVRAIIARDGKLLVMQRNKFGHRYNILVGGTVKFGETPEQALIREIHEECGFSLQSAKLVFIEEAGFLYGTQYIYVCDVKGDEPKLSPHSDESKIHALGQNLYTPMWLPAKEVAESPFRSERLKKAMLDGLKHGFPDEVVELTDEYVLWRERQNKKGG
jgi:8-oxo-dGTP pyrophosphatase MutT (NUDIX family)